MMNTSDSMPGVSGNEFLKDGCYSINVIQSLLKTNDFSFIFLIFLLLFFFYYYIFFSGAAENCRNTVDSGFC